MMRPAAPRDRRLSALIEALRGLGPVDERRLFAVVAPLRVCPLGAHVDHQGGVVTGLTVDRSVVLAATPASASRLEVASLNFAGGASIPLDGSDAAPAGDWPDYARAAVSTLSASHALGVGLRAVVGGDLPGSGLSSSAAVLIAYLMALAHVNGIGLSRPEISALVQAAENDFMGVASGRLDQSIILFADRGHLTRVDCSHLEVRQVRSPEGAPEPVFLVAFSGLTRALVGSGFNLRVAECRQAATRLLELAGRDGTADAVLADVDRPLFEAFGPALPEPLRRRAAHYFSEQARVAEGVEAWQSGDLVGFGRLMTASGESSIGNYECGTPEIIALWEALGSAPGVIGTRFSGAGFGGSCIALIEEDAGFAIIEEVRRKYAAAYPGPAAAATYTLCTTAGPAHLVMPVA